MKKNKENQPLFDDVVTFKLKSSMKSELEEKADKAGLSMSDIIRILIQRWLKDGRNII